MNTRLLHVHPEHPDPAAIEQAAGVLRRGGLVAFPTETVYGLGANALDPTAVAAIFAAKGRPSYDPLIVHLAAAADLPQVAAEVPPLAQTLAAAFWPGPLTLVLPRRSIVPDGVTAGRSTVAVRVPAHPVALALLRAAGLPIAAPSANRFGHTSPTTAAHVLNDLHDRVDLILDGGPTQIGVESTVLDLTVSPPRILRPGGLTREQIEACIGPLAPLPQLSLPVEAPPPDAAAQLSPGLLSRHYAPQAHLILYCLPTPGPLAEAALLAQMRARAVQEQAAGRKLGLLLAQEDLPAFDGLDAAVFSLGSAANLHQVAQSLYAGLRALDQQGVERILARDFGPAGLGLALSDRLRRAAEEVVGGEQ